jgi:RNA polymerase sigma-70 factor (ECF subfamily)
MQANSRPSPSDVYSSSSQLIEQIAASADRTAFARLFEFFAPRVKAYLQRLGAPADDAEAAAIEVMLAVWRQAARFDRREATAETFVFRIARNRRLETLRRPPSLRPVPSAAMGLEDEAQPEPLGPHMSRAAIALA